MTEQADVLVIAPHPDDAEYGAGGTVAGWTRDGKQVVFVVCTTGDKGTSDRDMAPERLAGIREKEQRDAARALGVREVVFLGYPDQGLEDIPEFRPQGFDAARRAFSERTAGVPWPEMAQGEAAFRGSLTALVEWAPVAPELKSQDTEIVETSMWFRWKAVRDQFVEVLDAPAVMVAWRAEPPQAAAGEEIAAPAN